MVDLQKEDCFRGMCEEYFILCEKTILETLIFLSLDESYCHLFRGYCSSMCLIFRPGICNLNHTNKLLFDFFGIFYVTFQLKKKSHIVAFNQFSKRCDNNLS